MQAEESLMENPLAVDLDHILEHTRSLWDELRGERLFITGGTGFFGCWLLESLVWANERLNTNCQAVVLTRDPAAFHAKAPHLAGHQSVFLLQGDVRTFDFPAGEFSHVIHAATYAHIYSTPLNPQKMLEENLHGTYHILDFINSCKASRLLFTSSGAVYGKQPPEISHISEEHAGVPDSTDPNTAYGQSKRVSEYMFSTALGLQTKIARCFTFLGPGLPLHTNYAVGNFISDAINGRPVSIKGDGTPRRSYLYCADLVIWLWTILFNGRSAFPYNVGSENDLSIYQLAETVVSVLAPGLPIHTAKSHDIHHPIERYVPATQRAKSELGLQEYVTLAEGIKRTARWQFQSHKKVSSHD
jgi:nucleoside-diphosphate-sugar epimerase